MLDKLTTFRRKIMSAPPPNRNIRIYHKRYDSRQVPHIIMDMDQEMEKNENAMIAKYWGKMVK